MFRSASEFRSPSGAPRPNTDYGLSAGVITNEMQKAMELAFGPDSGMVHLNDCTVSDEAHAPFGGVKNGDLGSRRRRFSMEEMNELKRITDPERAACLSDVSASRLSSAPAERRSDVSQDRLDDMGIVGDAQLVWDRQE